MPIDSEKFNIKEGKIAFELKSGRVNWQDNQLAELIKLTQNGNFISLQKTPYNKLKFSYLDVEIGKADLEIETDDLSMEQDYTLVLSWSTSNREIKLYINGELKGHTAIIPLD